MLVAVVAVFLWLARRRCRQRQQNFRNQARVHSIEGQLASFRSALRFQVAEHITRQRMRDALHDSDSLADRLDANGPWIQ